MATKSEIRVGVKFESDNKALEQSKLKLQELLNSVSKIKTEFASDWTGKPIGNFKQATQEMEKLANIVGNSWNTKLGQLDLTKFNQQVTQSYGGITQMKNALYSTGEGGVEAFNKIASSVLNTQVQIKQTSTLLDKMALTFANTIRFSISSSVINNITGSISKAYGYVKNLDSALNDIRIVSGQSADQMERFAKEANEAAKALGSSTLDYTQASLIYYQQGLSDKEVKARTDVTVKMANVLGASAQEVSDYMTAIWNNYSTGSDNLERFADVIAALGASTAASSEEIATGLEKFSAIAKTTGLSYEYATSALATIVANTRQSADTVGTALKTLFARIQDLELGKTLEDGTTLGQYAQALAKIGVSVKDSNGELRTMDDILNDMGAKWSSLNDAQKTALAQNVAGTRQYQQLMALMDNWDDFQTNVATAQNATGTLQQQQEIYLDSVEAHIQQLNAEIDKLYSNLLDEKAIKGFTDIINGALQVLNTYLTGLGGGMNTLLTLGSHLGTIFSGQIGKSIARQISNREIEQQNQAAVKTKDEWIDSIKADYKAKGKDVSGAEERLNAEAEYAKKIAGLQGKISEEEYNQLAAQQEQIGLYTDIVKKGENWQEELKGIYSQTELENISAKQIGEKFNDLNQKTEEWTFNLQEANDAWVALQQESLDGRTTKNSREEYLASEEGINNLELVQKQFHLTSHEIKQIKEGLIEGKNITKEYADIQTKITDSFKNQTDEITKQNEKLKHLKKGKEGKEYVEAGVVEGAKANINSIKGQAEATQNLVDNQIKYENVTRSITLLFSTWTSIQGIFRTLNNENLSTWEKIGSIISVVVTQGLMFAKNWKSFTEGLSNIEDILDDTAKIFSKNAETAAIKANTAAKQENAVASGEVAAAETTETVATNANTVAETANNTQKSLGIIAILKQIGAIISKTAALIAETAAIWAAVAAETVLAILTGNFAAVTGAAVVATIAFVAALGLIGYAIYKALDPETRLNAELERTAENVKKAKDAYKELSDTVSSYKDARSAIDELTEGTLEFYEAILESNEQAQELIDKLGLIAGTDYTIDKNGLINLNEESLQDKMFAEQQKIFRSTAAFQSAQIEKNQLQLDRKYKDVAREMNNAATSQGVRGSNLSAEQAKYILSGQGNKSLVNEKGTSGNLGIVGVVNDTFKRMDGKFNQVDETITKNSVDLQKVIDKNLADVKALQAQQVAANAQYAQAVIRGYASKEVVGAYNNMNATSQGYINDYIAQQRENNQLNASEPGLIGKNLSTDSSENLFIQGLKTNLIAALSLSWKNPGVLLEAATNTFKRENARKEYAEYTGETDFSTEDALSFVNNGTKSTIENTEDLINKYSSGFNYAQQQGLNTDASRYLGNVAMAAQLGDEKTLKENWGKLTTEERGQIKVDYGPYDLSMEQTQEDAGKRAQEDTEAYNNTLAAQAQQLDTTKTALELYGDALKGADESLNKTNTDTAEAIAASYKFNKEYNEGRKLYEDNKDALEAYSEALQENKKVSYDVADGAAEIVDSLKKIGITLKSKDLKNPDTIEKLNKLLSGTEEEAEDAYKALQKISIENVLNDAFSQSLHNFDSYRDNITGLVDYLSNLEIDPSGITTLDEEWANRLINMVNNAHMSMSEVEDLFNSLNLEIPEIDTSNMPEPELQTMPVKGYQTVHYYDGYVPVISSDGKASVSSERIQYSWLEGVEDYEYPYVQLAKGQNLKYKGGGNTRNFTPAASSSKGKSGGGGGGGSSKPKQEDRLKDEADRYHTVNTQITKVSNQLSKLQSQTDKFVGQAKIDNLTEQWQKLNKQVDNYNEKIKIAEGEQAELASKLAAKGVRFNADGTIANYSAAFQAQMNAVNGTIDYYNSLSADAQEGYQDTLDNAKEQFNQFKTDLDRYDELVSDFIPGLRESIQDAIDQQIELQIQKFNMEVEINLKLSEATKEWNEWKKKVIDGIKEEDILGNAQAKLEDFAIYYAEAANGTIQVQTRHLEDLLTDLREMDDTTFSKVYGNDKAKGLEDLQTYYTQLMTDLQNVLDMQNAIHDSYLSMMDEAKEKFAEQVKMYEQVSQIITHDVKVIQLTLGKDAYHEMANYYNSQKENYLAQVDFLKQQQMFWESELANAEEGSDEWKKAKENLLDSISSLSSAIEKSIENIQTAWENAIKAIFQDLNNEITEGKGLNYVNEEWNLINKNAKAYLDSINALQGIQNLESKYLKSINDTTNATAKKRLKALMDEELGNLREQDELTKDDLDRAEKKYQIELALLALEEARDAKTTMRLRRDTQGNYLYEYIADNDAIKAAEDKLSKLYNDLYNFDKEKYLNTLEQIYSTYDEYQKKMAEAALINDPQLRAEKEALIQEEYGELINRLVERNNLQRQNLYESAFQDLAYLQDKSIESFKNMTQEEQDMIMEDLIPQWVSGVQLMADVFAGPGGFAEVTKDAIDSIADVTAQYEQDLIDLEDTAKISFDTIANGIDTDIEKVQDLITNNDELINNYEKQLDAVEDVVDAIDTLVDKYHEAAAAAKEATTEAYNYWQEQQRQAQEVAKNDQLMEEEETPEPEVTPTNANASAGTTAGGGDGIPSLGDLVTFTGGDYYATSYGEGNHYGYHHGEQATITYINSSPWATHPYHLNNWGWVDLSQISGYDTGGYTGTWGQSGKLALLHQKELVLNANDTAHMLEAVNSLRSMITSIGPEIWQKVSAIGVNHTDTGLFDKTLEQHVSIDATFPGVTSSIEIQDALNNLVNIAAQKANEDR